MGVEQRVSVRKFKELFGLKEYTARNLVRIADFPSVKLGSRYYVDVPRAIEWFKKRESSAKVDLQEHRVITRR
jgi:hypothetical protein